MPQWGLDTDMRRSMPWGLSEHWLEPGKVITDPIHGDIYLTVLEETLVDTSAFQRLRRVKQLSTTHLVYPGATHTRFSHSLGALRVVQDLFDVAWRQRNGNHPVEDLFTEWDRDRQRDEDGEADVDTREAIRVRYVRRVAAAMVLARLGALLHDICHVPFGHSIEDDLKILLSHDKNVQRFDRLWGEMREDVRRRLERAGQAERFVELDPLWSGDLLTNLRPLILSKDGAPGEDPHLPPDYPFVGDMVGNTICADLLDYLQRDHRFTGLPMSLGARFMSAFYVTPSNEVLYPGRMALLLHRQGRERKDVKTELLKHLRYRYELQERVLVHHAKLAADAMVGKMLELWRDALAAGSSLPAADSSTENVLVLSARSERGSAGGTAPGDAIRQTMEDVFLEVGDDGLLERLARGDTPGCATPEGVSDLAMGLLSRDLYRHAANASGAFAATQLHSRFSAPDERRRLETEAARYAGLREDWHVVIWLPKPEMRLKLAQMLVDHGRGIARFVDYSQQGSEIYDAHKALWTVSVYVHPGVSESQRKAVLAKLAELMGLCWDRYESELGADPQQWTARLAAMEALGQPAVDAHIQELLTAVEEDHVAARGNATATYEADKRRYEEIARRKGLIATDPSSRSA
jgi:HD superfamily phosphohydrolase